MERGSEVGGGDANFTVGIVASIVTFEIRVVRDTVTGTAFAATECQAVLGRARWWV